MSFWGFPGFLGGNGWKEISLLYGFFHCIFLFFLRFCLDVSKVFNGFYGIFRYFLVFMGTPLDSCCVFSLEKLAGSGLWMVWG